MYDYYREDIPAMPAQSQFNPMAAMPVQSTYNPMMNMPAQTPYNPMMNMPAQAQYNPMMNMPAQAQYNPMMNMPAQSQTNQMAAKSEQLEKMYPKTYQLIKPAVENACENMAGKKGQMYVPTEAELESMITDVYNNVESEVEANIKKSANPEERQFLGGGRRILRDFIGVLLITSLLNRRRPFYPGFYGGFGYPYYFY